MNFFFNLAFLLLFSNSFFKLCCAEESGQDGSESKEVMIGKKKVVYVYKQYEKIDFNDLDIQGDTGFPNDLSINSANEKRFTNRLPYRKSFNFEIKRGIERVR